MTTLFIIALATIDVILICAVIWLGKRNQVDGQLIADLTDERKYLNDLRTSIQEDLENFRAQSREAINKISGIASEAEMEVKEGGKTLSGEMEQLIEQITPQFETPLAKLSKERAATEKLLVRTKQEKDRLAKAVQRGERLVKFFNDKIPYEDVLIEIQDKKYQDARHMLAGGHKVEAISEELGLPVGEVRALAGLT